MSGLESLPMSERDLIKRCLMRNSAVCACRGLAVGVLEIRPVYSSLHFDFQYPHITLAEPLHNPYIALT